MKKLPHTHDDTRLPRETKYQRDDRIGRTPPEIFPEPSIKDVVALAECNGGNFANARHHAGLAIRAGLRRMEKVTPVAYAQAQADRDVICAATESFNETIRAAVGVINETETALIARGTAKREADAIRAQLADVIRQLDSPEIITRDPAEAFHLSNLAKHLPSKIEGAEAAAAEAAAVIQRLVSKNEIDVPALLKHLADGCIEDGRIVNNDVHDLSTRGYLAP